MTDPPDDLPPGWAAAWVALAGGASLAEAGRAGAESIDRPKPFAPGTVAKRVRRWRAEFGDQLFREPRQVVAAQNTEVARAAAEQAWALLREEEALNLGITASQVRNRILTLLGTVGTSWVDRGVDGDKAGVVMHGPSARSITDLATAVEKLIGAAELLDGRPTRHTRRSVQDDQWAPPRAPGAGEGLSRADAEAKVIDLRDRIRERRAAGQ